MVSWFVVSPFHGCIVEVHCQARTIFSSWAFNRWVHTCKSLQRHIYISPVWKLESISQFAARGRTPALRADKSPRNPRLLNPQNLQEDLLRRASYSKSKCKASKQMDTHIRHLRCVSYLESKKYIYIYTCICPLTNSTSYVYSILDIRYSIWDIGYQVLDIRH